MVSWSGAVVSAQELDEMSAAERQAAFEEGVVTDLSQVPPILLDRVQTTLAVRIAERDRQDTQTGGHPGERA